MEKTLKYFMWGYQEHFRHGIQLYAERLFNELSKELKSNVFLLGILRNNVNGFQPICIEPEECGVNVKLFEKVGSLAQAIQKSDPKDNVMHSNPYAHELFREDLIADCRRQAVKQLIDENFRGKGLISFVSLPIMRDNYEIFIIIQFDEDIYNSFYSLKKPRLNIYGEKAVNFPSSFLHSVVKTFLYEARDALYKPRAGVYVLDEIRTNSKDLLRIAGASFIGYAIPVVYESYFTRELFETCNFISSLRYEGGSTIGSLVLCKTDHPNIKALLQLSEPVKLNDHRKIRKLLEITSEEIHLYCDGTNILGFVNYTGEYNSENEDLFIIKFLDSHKWQFIHDSHIMMNVEYSNPSLPAKKIDITKLADTLKRTFKNITEDELTLLLEMIESSTEQRHGTLLIISAKANEEATRLKKQSINIYPICPNDDMIRVITSIDGAVLLDFHGSCYAIGVILDGVASEKGDSSRGARYNSAIRYVESNKGDTVAVIVSEDGMIDVYPQLRPRIRESDIVNKLEELRHEVGLSDVDYDRYLPIMNWFDKHRFYLSQEICDEINELIAAFKSKLKMEVGRIYLEYPTFEPNPEMDNSYFFNE